METSVKTPETPENLQGKQVKICIVDDDQMYRQALKHKLGKNPLYKIFSYKSGEECISDLDKVNPDVVVLDYRLNDGNARAMNGVEILKRVKTLKPGTNVFMLSGQESFEIATNSVRNGAYDYVVKNENAYIRLEHLITKVLNHERIVRLAKKQLNYTFLILFVAILAVLTPILMVRSGSMMTPWYTIGAFSVLAVMLFALIRKTGTGVVSS